MVYFKLGEDRAEEVEGMGEDIIRNESKGRVWEQECG